MIPRRPSCTFGYSLPEVTCALRDAGWLDTREGLRPLKPAVRGILALAATEHGVAISPARLDSYPHLLNVANGVLDLNTGELLDHDPELLLT